MKLRLPIGIILGGAVFWARPEVISLLIAALILLALVLKVESKWLLGASLAGIGAAAILVALGQAELAKNAAVGCFYALATGFLASGIELGEPQREPSPRRPLLPRRQPQQLAENDLYSHKWVYSKDAAQGHRLPPTRRHGFVIDHYSK
jgi:hypothetical protein